MTQHPCFNCGPDLSQRRWLCPRCRQLYTFTSEGRMVARKAGEIGVFELKGEQSFAQFVLGGKRTEAVK